MKKVYPLCNLAYKILSIVLFILVLFLVIPIILYWNSKNWFIIIFLIFALVFFGYCSFVAFYSKIILEDNNMKIYYFNWFKPQKIMLQVKDILDIYIEKDGIKMNMIHIVVPNGEICVNGYNGGANYNKNIMKSIEIIENIKKTIK